MRTRETHYYYIQDTLLEKLSSVPHHISEKAASQVNEETFGASLLRNERSHCCRLLLTSSVLGRLTNRDMVRVWF